MQDRSTRSASSSSVRACPRRRSTTTATSGCSRRPTRIGANRFAYDERHVQALRLVRLLRERRHLSLETIRDVLPELLAVDEEAFRPDDVGPGRRVARRDGTGTRERDRRRGAATRSPGRGYADVNIADVAEAVGVGKGTVYRQFASKEDLFTAAAAAAVASVGRGVSAPGRGRRRVGRRRGGRGRALRSPALEPELPLLLELRQPGPAPGAPRRRGPHALRRPRGRGARAAAAPAPEVAGRTTTAARGGSAPTGRGGARAGAGPGAAGRVGGRGLMGLAVGLTRPGPPDRVQRRWTSGSEALYDGVRRPRAAARGVAEPGRRARGRVETLDARAGQENFPVALRVLPRDVRDPPPGGLRLRPPHRRHR